jgi:hypothetical protein
MQVIDEINDMVEMYVGWADGGEIVSEYDQPILRIAAL